MTWRQWGSLATLGLLITCAGCATPYKRAHIPLGEWSGSGYFVTVGQLESEEGGEAAAGVVRGEYPTTLKIERAEGADEDARRIEIVSMRGEYEDMEGDRTHLIALLQAEDALGDDAITLYRLTALGLSFDEEEPDINEGPGGVAHASCMLVDGVLVLRIHYFEGFVDTFHFCGKRVYKNGSFSTEMNEGFIHWSERLRSKR